LVEACLVYHEEGMDRAISDLVALGRPALAELIPLTGHENANVRWQSMVALDRINLSADELFHPVVRGCSDEDADVRGAAVLALARLFPDRSGSLAAVDRLCRDRHEFVRANAWMSRWRITGEQSAVGELVRSLASKDWMVSREAASHLVSIGEPALGTVTVAARDEGFKGRVGAIEVLGRMPGSASDTVAVLLSAARGSDRAVISAAILALGRAGKPAVTALIQLVRSSDDYVREQAIRGLGTIGPDAKTAVPLLGELLTAEPRVRVAVITALGRIGFVEQRLRARLIGLLEESEPDVRGAVAAALGGLGDLSVDEREALGRVAATDMEDFVRQAASEALRRIPP